VIVGSLGGFQRLQVVSIPRPLADPLDLAQDEAVAAADTLLITVPNQLGVDYNAHLMESLVTHVAPGLGWRAGSPDRSRATA